MWVAVTRFSSFVATVERDPGPRSRSTCRSEMRISSNEYKSSLTRRDGGVAGVVSVRKTAIWERVG